MYWNVRSTIVLWHFFIHHKCLLLFKLAVDKVVHTTCIILQYTSAMYYIPCSLAYSNTIGLTALYAIASCRKSASFVMLFGLQFIQFYFDKYYIYHWLVGNVLCSLTNSLTPQWSGSYPPLHILLEYFMNNSIRLGLGISFWITLKPKRTFDTGLWKLSTSEERELAKPSVTTLQTLKVSINLAMQGM